MKFSAYMKKASEESDKVIKFFSGVNLVNNADKAAVLVNSGRKGQEMIVQDIGGETLEAKKSEKLLGLHISSDLDWKVHIDKLCRVLRQRLGLLRRIKYKISGEKLPIIAEAIFTSKIRYGLAVYSKPRLTGADPECQEMRKLQTLQNDMLRVINGHRRSDHINMKKLRERMTMMSINQISCYHVLLEVHKVLITNSSEQLKNKMMITQESSRALRSYSNGDLYVPQKPSRGCFGFSYIGPKCYNMLPREIRQTKESGPFKRKMKKWVQTNIPD